MSAETSTALPETTNDLSALEDFVVRNPELERLESLLDRFNFFEAIGAVRKELRHSDFLGFLLDPSQNHGLGETFLKRFLQRILGSADLEPGGIRPVHLDVMGLSSTFVRREWQHIDVVCVSESNRLVVLIENKIDSGEGSDQLKRYLAATKAAYPGFTIIPIYLTPARDEPSNDGYIAVGYSVVCDTLEHLLKARQSTMGSDIFTAVQAAPNDRTKRARCGVDSPKAVRRE